MTRPSRTERKRMDATMKDEPSARRQLIALAKAWDVTVEDRGREIELLAPAGACFSPELHALVTAPQTDEEQLRKWRSALADLRDHLPLTRCEPDCSCFEEGS